LIRDLRKGFEVFFREKMDRSFLGGAMNPLVSLVAPERRLVVYLSKIRKRVHLQKVFDISDHPLHSSLFIGPSRITGANGKAIMSRKIEKLRIKDPFRRSLENDTFEIVIPDLVRNSAYLLEGSEVTIKEELHGMTRIEVDIEIPAISKDQNKPISHSEGELPLHPIHLSLLSRQKLQLMEPSGLLLA
jgi:hypothetical protein